MLLIAVPNWQGRTQAATAPQCLLLPSCAPQLTPQLLNPQLHPASFTILCQAELGKHIGVLPLVVIAEGVAAHGGVGVGAVALQHVVAPTATTFEEVGRVLGIERVRLGPCRQVEECRTSLCTCSSVHGSKNYGTRLSVGSTLQWLGLGRTLNVAHMLHKDPLWHFLAVEISYLGKAPVVWHTTPTPLHTGPQCRRLQASRCNAGMLLHAPPLS